jgi:hypothetical protein
MGDADSMLEFWKHWQHEPRADEEFERFRIRMYEAARRLWEEHFYENDDLRELFAFVSGTRLGSSPYFAQSELAQMLEEAENVFEVVQAMQWLLATVEGDFDQQGNRVLDACCIVIGFAIDQSPTIMVRLVRLGNTAMIYPAGARLLDEGVVESNLVWLAQYHSVRKPFEVALKAYAAKDPKQYRTMLDNLRFALEQMLRVVLSNQKSLENQKVEFLRWLKDHGMHAQIRNMYRDLLFGFAQYQNDAVKHQEDQYTPAEVEFALYATGTFLRLIQRVLEQETAAQSTGALPGTSPGTNSD